MIGFHQNSKGQDRCNCSASCNGTTAQCLETTAILPKHAENEKKEVNQEEVLGCSLARRTTREENITGSTAHLCRNRGSEMKPPKIIGQKTGQKCRDSTTY